MRMQYKNIDIVKTFIGRNTKSKMKKKINIGLFKKQINT